MRRRHRCVGILLLGLAPRVLSGQAPQPARPTFLSTYVPHRVYDSRHKQFIDFEAFVSRVTRADVVFVGEEHNDPGTHRMELALLEGLARRRDSTVLALEMFERDVQPLLDRYLAGAIPEDTLLALARPWKNYATDYRPLVELARKRGWPVVASNVPRPLAALVSRAGIPGLDTLTRESRGQAAGELDCPEDNYYDRFVQAMGDLSVHGPSPGNEAPSARVERMYQAQCLKDETMGESIAAAWRPGRLVVHYNGSFHSDYHQGTAARTERRLRSVGGGGGGKEVLVVSAIPVTNLDSLKPGRNDRKRADYLLYVLAPAKRDTTVRQ